MNTFIQSKSDFHNLLKNNSDIRIATLGPSGTSCDYTLGLLAKDIPVKESSKVLLNDFDQVYAMLRDGDVDMAMVPSAYRNSTRFYWAPEFQLAGTLVSKTPDYFFAKKPDKDVILSIATCQPVEHLLEETFSNDLPESYRVELTNSTVEAARAVSEGLAEACITNSFGLQHYGLKEIKSTSGVDMVWSFFRRGS